ncbi:MAG: tetratricopeptide repeat protein [Flavobacteriales bacterium]|nr:tetratricopeptide repeat protein [Flavobacteriales bacterium]
MKTVEELENILATQEGTKQRARTLLELNESLGSTDFLRSVQICREAVKLANELNDEPILAEAHIDLGNALWKFGENEEAQGNYVKGLAIYQRLNDHKGMADAYCGLGIVHGSLNDSANALEFFEKGVAVSTRSGNDVMLAHNLGNIGHIHANLEDHTTALRYFAKALAIDRELGKEGLQGVSNMLGAIAGVMVVQGEFDGAVAKLEECLVIDEEIANKRGTAVTLLNLGITYMKAGRFPDAITYLTRALAYSRKIHYASVQPLVHQNLAELYESIGDTKEAEHHFQQYNDYRIAEQRMKVQRKAGQIIAADDPSKENE